MDIGDNGKFPITQKWNHHSFKKINNAALHSLAGARILPFQRGKGKKKRASEAAQLVLTETQLRNVPFFTQERIFFKLRFQNYTVACKMPRLLLMKSFLQRTGCLPKGRKGSCDASEKDERISKIAA